MKKIMTIISVSLMLLGPGSAHALDEGEKSDEGAISGNYDILFYALTWQPTYCLLNGCVIKPGQPWYTHGIWPYAFNNDQKSSGHYPSSCVSSPGCNTESQSCQMSDAAFKTAEADDEFKKIVSDTPSALMKHEWSTHGTCTGWTQDVYFKNFVQMRPSPPDLEIPIQMSTIPPGLSLEQLKAFFPPGLSYRCASTEDKKQYLLEVLYPLNKEGQDLRTAPPLQIGDACINGPILVPAL